MRLGWVALPLLMAAPACAPVRNYQEAARGLRFTLDRVEPRLQVAFPLERSAVAFRITVGVENPSGVAFRIQGFTGDLRLESAGSVHPVGHLELAQALDLPPGGKAALVVELSFSYQDLKEHWGPLQGALRAGAEGAWKLEGRLRLDAFGFPFQLPVNTRRAFGAGR